jgi:sensor histidine kinase YesM
MNNIFLHIGFWLLLIILPAISSEKGGALNFMDFPIGAIGILGCALFYLNAYLLIPKFLHKGKRLSYFTLSVITILIVSIAFQSLMTHYFSQALLMKFNDYQIPENARSPFSRTFFIPFILFYALGGGYRVYIDQKKKEQILEELRAEKMKYELFHLKEQINPHFLLNMLNNLISLTHSNPDRVESTLIKLSEVLHHNLYLSSEEFILIKDELIFIESYIQLQEIRFKDNIRVTYNESVSELSNEKIIPFAFQPFLENAFKHGVGTLPDPEILIRVNFTQGQLTFYIENKIAPISESKYQGGIGILNTIRRLDLAYQDKYSINFGPKGNKYFVQLIILIND